MPRSLQDLTDAELVMVTSQVISVMTANPAPYGVTPAELAALGADIYVKLDGPPPTDASQCTFLTTDSKTPYMAEYDGSDAGKMAHYMLRWRMRDGTTGAWGETVSAPITG